MNTNSCVSCHRLIGDKDHRCPSKEERSLHAKKMYESFIQKIPREKRLEYSRKGGLARAEKLKVPIDFRFTSKFDQKDKEICWEWKGGKNKNGYGALKVGSRTDGSRRTIESHRLSFMYFHGEIPKGMCVLHKCDNRKCVNPNHLYVGTKKQNTLDAVSRGRFGPLKYGQDKIDQIRRLWFVGKKISVISETVGLSERYVYRVVRMQTRNERIIDGFGMRLK